MRVQADCAIFTQQSSIYIAGSLKLEHIPELMEEVRKLVSEARYPRITLNLERLENAYGSALTVLLARIKYLQANQIDVDVKEPLEQRALGQLQRSNFMSHAFGHKLRVSFRPDRPLPIFWYKDADEQGHAVNCATESLLFQIPNLDRSQLRAAQWAFSEITDNVLNHARSMVGGFAHSHINHQLKMIEFVVADAGIGVARTLEEPNHGTALQKAISEGVTRDKLTNQGNGLYGTWRLATLSKGIFVIHSYRGQLFVRKNGSVKVVDRATTFPGTYVVFQIDYSDPNLIAEALTFAGRLHTPTFDYIEEKFEAEVGVGTRLVIAKHVASTGSRESGRKLANLITNVIRMAEDQRVEIDFADILVISSSFADECFGRLIASMGPSEFFSRINFVNADSVIRTIIDRSVLQRLKLN
jgi:anti-anti-sigma regulatory factor/anti-sigma regulatory factor (Ser/Thr protein kinase)